ncbi:UPF0523 protein B [Psilocybe cubensis]|uniref:SnoaL-like domain-containing protein n=2 Tax=Psilocybe cubensis TaxID=181762 RepID=A0A8H8CHK9_PSICU|nr:UPF0523 protein B [Psilocybe cubensis]KAH9474677.1 UPF0523 protein B [Psilocybe cubensis]
MSTSEITRQVAQEWFGYVQNHHYEKLDALATPTANWWVGGSKDKIPVAGDMPYPQRRQSTQQLNEGADKSSTELVGLTVDGSVAVLEVHRTLDGPGEKHYDTYAIVKLILNEEGKIQEVREYLDFFALFKYLGVPGF